jgi:hypothetical protein
MQGVRGRSSPLGLLFCCREGGSGPVLLQVSCCRDHHWLPGVAGRWACLGSIMHVCGITNAAVTLVSASLLREQKEVYHASTAAGRPGAAPTWI